MGFASSSSKAVESGRRAPAATGRAPDTRELSAFVRRDSAGSTRELRMTNYDRTGSLSDGRVIKELLCYGASCHDRPTAARASTLPDGGHPHTS